MKLPLLISLSLTIAVPNTIYATTSFIDDFSTYGTSLTTGDTTDNSIYTWDVTNLTNSPTSVTVDENGAHTAWHATGHNENAAKIDLVFMSPAQPELEGIDFSFDLVLDHGNTLFSMHAVGHTAPEIFTFTSPGNIEIEFTGTAVEVYQNSALVETRLYVDTNWVATDKISSFEFVGLNDNNAKNKITSIDNINFSQIPEPSSSTLFGLATICVLVRRKR